jgi:hypothetical protein
MHIIISTTSHDLWSNNINIRVFTFIYGHSKNILKPDHIYALPRHDLLVLSAFRDIYGPFLENCPFAKQVFLPDLFKPYYYIDRIECYKYVYFPEEIMFNKEKVFRDESSKIIDLVNVPDTTKQKLLTELQCCIKKYSNNVYNPLKK